MTNSPDIPIQRGEVFPRDAVPYKGLEAIEFGSSASFNPSETGVNSKVNVVLEGVANSGDLKLGELTLMFRLDSEKNALRVAFVDNVPTKDVQLLCADREYTFWSHNLEYTPETDRSRRKVIVANGGTESLIVLGEKELKAGENTQMPLIILRVKDRLNKTEKQFYVRSSLENKKVSCEIVEGQLKTQYDQIVDAIRAAEMSGNEQLYMDEMGNLLAAIQDSLNKIPWGSDYENTINRLPNLKDFYRARRDQLQAPWKEGEKFRIISDFADTIDNNGKPSSGRVSEQIANMVVGKLNSYTKGKYFVARFYASEEDKYIKSPYGIVIKMHKMGSKLPGK